jgi:cell division protein FtsB
MSVNQRKEFKMKRKMMILGLVVLSLGAAFVLSSDQQVNAAEKKKLLRIGVYDSRGIAIAYFNSEHFEKILAEKRAALEQAKKENDPNKVKELEIWGPQHQATAHRQGFGTAPVHECFECIKEQIPSVAKTAGVDVIVSKWELDYLVADADVVDVTMELAKLFNPREQAYQAIGQLKDHKPISTEEIERLEKEEPDF